MDAERTRAFLLTLPHVTETMQWGANLVFWVGDKSIGGKMFALINLDEDQGPQQNKRSAVISYSAGRERYDELLEREGIFPAPYMARIHWVAVEHWHVFRNLEWDEQLRTAHAITFAKLPPRTQAVLAMPAIMQRQLVQERQHLLAARAPSKSRGH